MDDLLLCSKDSVAKGLLPCMRVISQTAHLCKATEEMVIGSFFKTMSYMQQVYFKLSPHSTIL